MSDYGNPADPNKPDPNQPNQPDPNQPGQADWSQPSQPPCRPAPGRPGRPGLRRTSSTASSSPTASRSTASRSTAQPYGQPAGAPPQNYLVWAILSTLFCCLPLGIASIVFAAQVNGKYAAGDLAGAQESSEKAKKFAIWSAIAGVVVIGLYILFVVVAAAGSDS